MTYSLAGDSPFFDFLVSLEDPTWQLVKICSTCKVMVCCAWIFLKGLPHLQVLCYKSRYYRPPSNVCTRVRVIDQFIMIFFPPPWQYRLGSCKKWALNGYPFTPREVANCLHDKNVRSFEEEPCHLHLPSLVILRGGCYIL
jgi:hypothetical protein